MDNEAEAGEAEEKLRVVHSWDTQTRRIACGAPGQIGSTKHARDVTCGECRVILGRPAQADVQAAAQH